MTVAAPRSVRRLVRFSPYVVAFVAFVAVVLATSRFGVGLAPDSVVYANGARNLADGNGFTNLDGGPIALFAPGYAAVLALADLVGIDVFDFARYFDAAMLALVVLLAYALARRHLHSPVVIQAATLLVGSSAVLLEIFTKALSESAFVPVTLASVIVCEEIMWRPAGIRAEATAVVLVWAAFYLRYPGIVLAGVGAGAVLARARVIGWRPAVARAGVFVAACVSAPVLWMLRNVDAVGDPLGPRYAASRSLTRNVADVAGELSVWAATDLVPGAIRVLVFGSVIVIVAVLGVLLGVRRIHLPHDADRLAPLALFVAAYVVYLVVSASLVAFRPIETRFLVPVFVPLVVLGAWLFEKLRDALPRARSTMNMAGVVFVVVNVVWFVDSTVTFAREGAGGYARDRWQHSALLRDAARLDPEVLTFTNDIRAVELFLGVPMPQVVAKRKHAETEEETTSLPDFVRTVECAGRARLVWFEPNNRPQLYTPEDLARSLGVRPLAVHPDGVVYELLPRGEPPAEGCRQGS